MTNWHRMRGSRIFAASLTRLHIFFSTHACLKLVASKLNHRPRLIFCFFHSPHPVATLQHSWELQSCQLCSNHAPPTLMPWLRHKRPPCIVWNEYLQHEIMHSSHCGTQFSFHTSPHTEPSVPCFLFIFEIVSTCLGRQLITISTSSTHRGMWKISYNMLCQSNCQIQTITISARVTHITLFNFLKITSSSSADDILAQIKVKVISKLCPTNDSFCSSKRQIQSK